MNQERPKQTTDTEMEARLLGIVRGQFCSDLTDKQWFQHIQFVRVNVILWSARFVTKHGFTLPGERFEGILKEVFMDIKRHGQTGQVRYWPGYLMKCVQDHWQHHWEDYYKEAKSVRNLAEAALVNSGKVTAADRTVETLALAHQVLTGNRRKKRVGRQPKQLNLLDT